MSDYKSLTGLVVASISLLILTIFLAVGMVMLNEIEKDERTDWDTTVENETVTSAGVGELTALANVGTEGFVNGTEIVTNASSGEPYTAGTEYTFDGIPSPIQNINITIAVVENVNVTYDYRTRNYTSAGNIVRNGTVGLKNISTKQGLMGTLIVFIFILFLIFGFALITRRSRI